MSGDTAVINAGTVSVTGTLTNIGIQLNGSSGGTAAPTLALDNATLDFQTSLFVDTSLDSYNAAAPTISVSGTSALGSQNYFSGQKINFTITSGSTLINGGMRFESSVPLINGGGTFQNSGTVALLNPGAVSQNAVIDDAITGYGTIGLGRYARIEIAASVGSGQKILLNDGASGNAFVQLDNVVNFSGTIDGFSSSDVISLPNTTYTSATYTDTTNIPMHLGSLYEHSGTLSLFNGSLLVGTINFLGSYTLSSFNLTSKDLGNGLSSLQITTTVVNQQSGGLLGEGVTGNGNPVYRFFNTNDGTHLLTQSPAEALQILSTRSDLRSENNTFGAVPSVAPSAEPIYRFFEQANGTHFFTASTKEFLGLTTPGTATYRPDFTYEPASTFYEDSVQQSGDVPVYRLFDSTHGTEFLTSGQAEYQGLVTPGNSAYRADLIPEGIAFYAPTGFYLA